MPQKKISQLTSVSSDVVNSSDTLEICTLNSNRAKASRKISLRDIGKAIFSKFGVSDNSKTIKQEIEEAKENNKFDKIILVDETGAEWYIWANSTKGIMWRTQEAAAWLQEMAEYMEYMYAQDNQHNYTTVYENSSSEYRTQMKSLGDELVAIYSNNIDNPDITQRSTWNTKKYNFDYKFKTVRFGIDSVNSWDTEYQAQKNLIDSFNTTYGVYNNLITNATEIPVYIDFTYESLEDVANLKSGLQTNYLQNYVSNILLSNAIDAQNAYIQGTTISGEPSGTKWQTESLLTTLVQRVKEAKPVVDGEVETLINYVYEHDGIVGYNTYFTFCTLEPQTHNNFGNYAIQEEFDATVANLKQDLQDCMTLIKQVYLVTPDEETGNKIFSLIRSTKEEYNYAQELINSYYPQS